MSQNKNIKLEGLNDAISDWFGANGYDFIQVQELVFTVRHDLNTFSTSNLGLRTEAVENCRIVRDSATGELHMICD